MAVNAQADALAAALGETHVAVTANAGTTAPATATILEKVMSKYTSEQAFLRSEDVKYSIGIDYKLTPACSDEVIGMLRDYAALLRERESAKAGVTDEMVHVVASAMAKLDGADPDHLIWEGSPPEPWGEVWCRYEDSARTVLEAVAPMLASASDKHLEQEQDDTDKILAKLGLTVERARTECGYLRVNDILNHIQETLDALAEAHSARVEMTDRYIKLASARVPESKWITDLRRELNLSKATHNFNFTRDEVMEMLGMLAAAPKPETEE